MRVSCAQGRLVRERFLVMREACIFMQRFVRSKLASRKYNNMRRAVLPIQALIRGHVARRQVQKLHALNMAVDEAWKVQSLKASEVSVLMKDAAELHSEAFWVNAAVATNTSTSVDARQQSMWARPMFRVMDMDIVADNTDVYSQV